MAGHSKFKNIQFRKGAQDKKRSKIFSKLSRDITLAAKQGLPDPNSNARLLRERLFVGEAGAAQYLPLTDYAEPALKRLMPFDAVVLGMGEDGHIASLIPGSPVLAHAMDPEGAALTAESPQGFGSPPVARITLTLSALLQSRAIFLLIAGEAKRQVIETAAAPGPGAGGGFPVRAILGQDRVPVRIFWAPN